MLTMSSLVMFTNISVRVGKFLQYQVRTTGETSPGKNQLVSNKVAKNVKHLHWIFPIE